MAPSGGSNSTARAAHGLHGTRDGHRRRRDRRKMRSGRSHGPAPDRGGAQARGFPSSSPRTSPPRTRSGWTRLPTSGHEPGYGREALVATTVMLSLHGACSFGHRHDDHHSSKGSFHVVGGPPSGAALVIATMIIARQKAPSFAREVTTEGASRSLARGPGAPVGGGATGFALVLRSLFFGLRPLFRPCGPPHSARPPGAERPPDLRGRVA